MLFASCRHADSIQVERECFKFTSRESDSAWLNVRGSKKSTSVGPSDDTRPAVGLDESLVYSRIAQDLKSGKAYGVVADERWALDGVP